MSASLAVLVRFCTKVREISRGVATNFWYDMLNPKKPLKIRFRPCVWGCLAFGGECEYGVLYSIRVRVLIVSQQRGQPNLHFYLGKRLKYPRGR